MDDLDYRYLLAQLTHHERFRLRHYQDAGVNLSVARRTRHPQRPTVTAQDATTALEDDLRRIAGQLQSQLPAFGKLDAVRQRVLLHIAFNIGVGEALKMRRFISAISVRHWSGAADEMLLSKWGGEDKPRAHALAEMMRSGTDRKHKRESAAEDRIPNNIARFARRKGRPPM
jgi:lysozyme